MPWEQNGKIGVLRLTGEQNALNAESLDAFERGLDRAEQEDIEALVTTGTDRFYSTGLDLAWLSGEGRSQAAGFLERLERVFARLLTFPIATIAAINGHAFAGGAMLALCHDRRIMRSDRGFFCLPEIDLATGQSLTPGMVALIRMKLPRQAFHEAIVSGRRYGGPEALSAGIVQETTASEALMPRALALAEEVGGHDRPTMLALKRQLASTAVDRLVRPAPAARS